MNKQVYFILLLLFLSCNQKGLQETKELYDLEATDEYITLHLDDSTYIPLSNVSYYRFDNTDYLAFVNKQTAQLIIYDITKGEIYRKLVYQTEGENSIVGYISDFYMKELDEIYLLSPYTNYLYQSNGDGMIVEKVDCSEDNNGIPLTRNLSSLGRMELVDGKFYLTQNLNRTYGDAVLEKSCMSAVVDMDSKQTELLPLTYPSIISLEDLGTNAGYGYQYRRIFDGAHFIYSFLYSDMIYKVSPDHRQTEVKRVASKYIPEVKVNRLNNSDFRRILKMTCEEATYEDIVYDKYRKVYYRFACPQTEVDPKESYLEIIRYGKQQFSVVILDENMNRIGEKLFPPFTYVPTVHIVKEDGLYISCSHYKNPDYSDDLLRLQKIIIVKK